MEQSKVTKYLQENRNMLFPNGKYTEEEVEVALMEAPDTFEDSMNKLPLRSPTITFMLAFFIGASGTDRLYLGDIKKWILKFMTLGGMFIWWIADIFSAKKRCRTYNCENLMNAVNDPAVLKDLQRKDEAIGKAVAVGTVVAAGTKDIAKSTKKLRNSFEISNPRF